MTLIPRPSLAALSFVPAATAGLSMVLPVPDLVPSIALVALAILAALDVILSATGPSLVIKSRRSPALSLGKPAIMAFELENPSAKKILAVIRMDEPPELQFSTHEASISIEPVGDGVIEFTITPSRRGPCKIERLYIATVSALRLFTLVRRQPVNLELSVLPSLEGLARARARIRKGRHLSQGFKETPRPGEDGDFDSIRSYSPGEDARHIDWKMSARSDDAKVRLRQSSSRTRVAFAVDSGRLMSAERAGRSALDHALAAVIATGDAILRAGDSVSALAFADGIRAETAELSSSSGLLRLARFASNLEPRSAEADFVQAAARLRSILSKRSLIVLVTEASDTMPIAALERAVRELARTHAVVVAFMRDEEVERAEANDDEGLAATYRAAAAAELLEIRDRAVASLRRYATVLVVSAASLTDALAGHYLEAKAARRI